MSEKLGIANIEFADIGTIKYDIIAINEDSIIIKTLEELIEYLTLIKTTFLEKHEWYKI